MKSLRLATTVTNENKIKIMIEVVENPLESDLLPQEVVVRVDAAPINPSDIMSMLPTGAGEPGIHSALQLEDGFIYSVDEKVAPKLAQKVGKMMGCGLEGAGVVVKTGSSNEAKAFLNKVVAVAKGNTYAEYRKSRISEISLQNEGTTPEQAASSFVNPMTVVGFVETMKQEGHQGIIHTAAASQLGQMLVRLCILEDITLINIVRKESQEKLLRDLGAKHIVRSDKPSFIQDLAAVVGETRVTLAFDAIGGGDMASQILTAMENGAKTFAKSGHYGTNVLKQIYIYGALDMGPTSLSRGFGGNWNVSSWLMPGFLEKQSLEKIVEMKKFIADNIDSVFKTEYYKHVSLQEIVRLENFLECLKQETGKKFLIVPSKNR